MKNLNELYQQITKLLSHVEKKDRRNLVAITIATPLVSLFEIAAVSSVVPFLGIIVDPNKYLNLSKYSEFLQSIGIFNTLSLLYLALVLFSLFQLATGFARLAMISAITRMSFKIAVNLSQKIYKNLIYKDYLNIKLTDTSEATAILTTHVSSMPYHILIPLLTIINSFFSLLFLFILLSYVSAPSVSVLIGGISIIFLFLFYFTNNKLRKNSVIITNETSSIFSILRETFSGFRDILIYNLQNFNISLFVNSNRKLRDAQRINQIILQTPRPTVESLGMLLIAIVTIYILDSGGSLIEVVPVLGLFALSAQRALPHLQSIFTSIGTISGSYDSLRQVVAALENNYSQTNHSNDTVNQSIYTGINLKNVSFAYSQNLKPVLLNISMSASKGENICIYGPTGGGKSTLLDIIMGLIVPNVGEVTSGNFRLSEQNSKEWRRWISHVPQSIFLANLTIAENIALGFRREEINDKKLIECAKIAQIHEQILLQERGYETIVGENGARLSGGQRQRIGIARALYRGGEILVLDESTSGLDAEIERKVFDSLLNSKIFSTIILVTHKLSLLDLFDKSYKLQNGELFQSLK